MQSGGSVEVVDYTLWDLASCSFSISTNGYSPIFPRFIPFVPCRALYIPCRNPTCSPPWSTTEGRRLGHEPSDLGKEHAIWSGLSLARPLVSTWQAAADCGAGAH